MYYPYFFFPFPLFFIFGIFAFFWIVRWLVFPWRWGWGYRGRYWRYQDESYYIIRERYAKGEITKEQFEQMMRDLQQHNTTQPPQLTDNDRTSLHFFKGFFRHDHT